VTKDLATHPQKWMHVWMADMIVLKFETRNQFYLFGEHLNINFWFSYFLQAKFKINWRLNEIKKLLETIRLQHNSNFQVHFKGPKISGPWDASRSLDHVKAKHVTQIYSVIRFTNTCADSYRWASIHICQQSWQKIYLLIHKNVWDTYRHL